MSNTKEEKGPSVDPELRLTAEYTQGKNAFHADVPVDSCPYPRGNKRTSWLCGWYDERTRDHLGHIFEKRNLQWP